MTSGVCAGCNLFYTRLATHQTKNRSCCFLPLSVDRHKRLSSGAPVGSSFVVPPAKRFRRGRPQLPLGPSLAQSKPPTKNEDLLPLNDVDISLALGDDVQPDDHNPTAGDPVFSYTFSNTSRQIDVPVKTIAHSTDPVNNEFFFDVLKHMQQPQRPFTVAHSLETQLMNILRGHPLYLYDKIRKWAEEAHELRYFDDCKQRSRDHYLKTMYKRYDLVGTKPRTTEVVLTDGSLIDVVTFDFKRMLHSILSNPDIMQESNLLFDPKNPHAYPPFDPSKFGDLHTGRYYQEAFRNLCNGPSDVLCPISLFVDKSGTDLKSNLTSEPATFAPSFFR